MGLFDRSPKATRQTVVQAVGAGSIAAGGNITGVVVTGDNNRVASATSHGNDFGDREMGAFETLVTAINENKADRLTKAPKARRATSHMIANGVELVSDGTWKGEIKIEDGKLFVNGRLIHG